VIKTILLITIALLLNSCGTRTYLYTGEKVIENKTVKLRSPLGKYLSSLDKLIISAKGRDGRINFYKRDIPGTSYVVNFSSYNENYSPLDKYYGYLFNPQLDWKAYEKELQTKTRRHGYRVQKVYLHNLACSLISYSNAPFDYMASHASKDYTLKCGYYAKDGTKKAFVISHFYATKLSKKSFTYGDIIGKNYQGKYSPVMFMEQDFQRSAKYMIDSIELKEIDIPRMKREGLYHEGKGKEFHYPVW